MYKKFKSKTKYFFPNFYVFCQKQYYGIRYIFEKYIIGMPLQKLIWKYKHLYDKNYKDNNHVLLDITGEILTDSLNSFRNINSLLDAGCGIGRNLTFIRKSFPNIHLHGVDINKHFLKIVQKSFEKNNDKLISLYNSPIDDLSMIKTGSVDIVISDAVLIYTTPDKIERTLMEFKRVSRKGIILIEFNLPDNLEYIYKNGRWIYNYQKYFKKLFSNFKIQVKNANRGNPLDDWNIYGKVIKVEFIGQLHNKNNI